MEHIKYIFIILYLINLICHELFVGFKIKIKNFLILIICICHELLVDFKINQRVSTQAGNRNTSALNSIEYKCDSKK